jgi:hypothetical protein
MARYFSRHNDIYKPVTKFIPCYMFQPFSEPMSDWNKLYYEKRDDWNTISF